MTELLPMSGERFGVEGKIIRGKHYILQWGIRNRNSGVCFCGEEDPRKILGVGNADARKTYQVLTLEEDTKLAVLQEEKMKYSIGNRLLNIALSEGGTCACSAPFLISVSFLSPSLERSGSVGLGHQGREVRI